MVKKIVLKGAIISEKHRELFNRKGCGYTCIEDIALPSNNIPVELVINDVTIGPTETQILLNKMACYKGEVTTKLNVLTENKFISLIAMMGDYRKINQSAGLVTREGFLTSEQAVKRGYMDSLI